MSLPSPPTDAPRPSVEDFLKCVVRSRLLDRAQLQAALLDVPPDRRADSHALAEHLVKKGKLSRYQATKLLKGTGRGLLLGNYQLLAPLGKGGMGAVYMARDQRDGRLVALKVLPPQRAKSEERTVVRFQREMELSRRVSHPNVALTYETGRYKDVYFIAMEYIPGKSLYRVVTEDGPLPVARAAHLFAEAAAGLQHAHDQGLIHRDLKPSNLMVTPNDHAKVLDLGLALVQGETGELSIVGGQGYIVGSMDYISPEQTADASKVDGRSDVYGLGCTLYFAFSGQPPFPGGTPVEKIQRHRTEDPVPLDRLKPELPPVLAKLVQRMMAKDPIRRFPSARAVANALRPWATGEAVRPLDRPDDSAFRIAIATLQTAEPPSEFASFDPPGVGDTDEFEGPTGSGSVIRPAVRTSRRYDPRLSMVLLVGGVGAVVGLVCVFLICLLGLLLRR